VKDGLESLQKRVDELESQLAFQDELIDSLNSTVARQDFAILELKQQINRVAERLREIGETAPGAVPQDETPPHY
jgi:SlyX protein